MYNYILLFSRPTSRYEDLPDSSKSDATPVKKKKASPVKKKQLKTPSSKRSLTVLPAPQIFPHPEN